MIRANLRDEALLLLEGKGAILRAAREVSEVVRQSDSPAAVIGGVAVVLHGYVRTTSDVDVFVGGDVKPFAARLRAHGMNFDSRRREFLCHGVPVHIVTEDEVGEAPVERVEIDGILTVSLPDLINMKLRSGLSGLSRTKDLADVVELTRARRLPATFASKLHRSLRADFRKIVKAVRADK